MAKKHRLSDIAKLAGVGTATVDRVLNERGNVSAEMVERVLGAAQQLDHRRILPPVHRRTIRIEALLPRPELPLITRMNHEFSRQSERLDRTVQIQRTTLTSEAADVVARRMSDTTCDAVVVYAQEHPSIMDAVEKLHNRGVPVVTIISDLPSSGRLAYAGTNHYAAGRTAAFFMSKMAPKGDVLILCNHFGFESHSQRVRGFQDGLKQYRPDLHVADILAGEDQSLKSEKLLVKGFRDHRGVIGLYNVGAANDACGTAIQSEMSNRPLIFIGHELTHETRPMLQDGIMTLAIDQNPEHQARFAVDVLLHHFGLTTNQWLKPPYPSNVSFRLISPENILTFSGPASPTD